LKVLSARSPFLLKVGWGEVKALGNEEGKVKRWELDFFTSRRKKLSKDLVFDRNFDIRIGEWAAVGQNIMFILY
jgi:hypothetical protein